MPPYDDRLFAPPAPVLSGTIAPEVLLVIDTGADVTLLPLGAVNADGIQHTGGVVRVTAFDGRSSSFGAVRADLLMLGRTVRGQFLVIDQEVGILGCNIHNVLSLLLQGPQQRASAKLRRSSAGGRWPAAA